MPTTLEDIKEREEQLKRTGAKATQLAGVGSEFMSQVRDELRKRAEDKGVSELTKAAAATRKEFAAAPARIREEYKDIDPFRRMTLESERRGDIMAELTEIMDLKGAREAGITDILEMGRAGIQAESERAQAQFGMEQKLYENVVGQWKAEQEIRLKEIDQAIELEQVEANRTYQNGMLAYYSGQLDLGAAQLEESQRHAMAAELLDAEKNRITEELGYAGFASAERVAGIQASSREAPAPTYPVVIGGKTFTVSGQQAATWESEKLAQRSRERGIADAISVFTSQGMSKAAIVEAMDKAGYNPEEYASYLITYQEPKKKSWWNPFD